MLLSLAIWLQNLKLFQLLRESDRGYETLLSLHVSSIALFGAAVVVTDLRLLGVLMRDCSIASIVNQMRVPKRIGLTCIATFGFLMFGMKAEEYYYNPFFRTKLVLLALVATHALIFRPRVYNHPEELDKMKPVPTSAKLAAVFSLLLWLCLVCAGRGIGYIFPPPLSHHFTTF